MQITAPPYIPPVSPPRECVVIDSKLFCHDPVSHLTGPQAAGLVLLLVAVIAWMIFGFTLAEAIDKRQGWPDNPVVWHPRWPTWVYMSAYIGVPILSLLILLYFS